MKLWKLELQRLADETGIEISVCHLPPGTSKWNKIEHRLFSFITQDWRGKPLVSHEVIVNLIARTTAATGLRVRCELDTDVYIQKESRCQIRILPESTSRGNDFHREWNYTIGPRRPSK